MAKWIPTEECKLCGKSLCVMNENQKVGYCYRQQKFFFLNRDDMVYFTCRKNKEDFLKEQRMSNIFSAVNSKAYAEIVKAVKEGQDINSHDEQGRTALTLAIENQDDTSLGILLECGASPNQKDIRGSIPLLLAIEKGSVEIITALLDKGADVNTKEVGGKTPLSMTVEKENEVLVSRLLEKGAQVNVADEQGRTPLTLAIEKENEQLAVLLLEKGADVNYRNEDGKTPLLMAVEKESQFLVSSLLERGADINIADESGKTPLLVAIENNTDLARILIEKGANVNVVDKEGKTPLLSATLKKSELLVALLLEKGADVNYKFNGQSLTDIGFSKGYYSLVTLLVKKGGSLGGYSIVSAVKKLVEKVDSVRSIGQLQDYQIVKGLIKESVGLDAVGEEGETILHVLVKNYNPKLMYLLNMALSNGANPNIQDEKGRTPLHYAALSNNVGLIRILITQGANVNLPDKNSVTPYQITTMLASVQVLKASKDEKVTVVSDDAQDESLTEA